MVDLGGAGSRDSVFGGVPPGNLGLLPWCFVFGVAGSGFGGRGVVGFLDSRCDLFGVPDEDAVRGDAK